VRIVGDGVHVVRDGDGGAGHGEEVDGALALLVAAERPHDQRVAVEDDLTTTRDVGEPGEPHERVVPLGPLGLPGLAATAEGEPRAEPGVVVDPDQVAVLAFRRPMVEQVRQDKAELHVPRGLTHPLERPYVAVTAVVDAHSAVVLVESGLVVGEEVDA